MTDTSEADVTPQTNGFGDGEEDDRTKMRPADIDADMREMERRKRVEMIMSSRLFREELERIIEAQMKDGNGPAGLLQQISDMMGIQGGRLQSANFFKTSNCVVPINDIRGVESMGYAKGEKILRCKLAAVYRLMDLYGWTQNIYNHITARLNQDQEHFLVNPFGMLYHEVTASSLVKVDMQGHVVESGTTNFGVNVAGFQLHGAVHAARPDIKCIIHLHTPPVLAVSSLKCGLLPLCQESVVIGEASQHTYLGSINEPEEKEKLARDLGPINKVVFLTNHGALCCGETIEEAFYNVYNTVLACEIQLKLIPVGIDNLQLIPDETRKQIYDSARHTPEGTAPPPGQIDKKEKRFRIGGLEFEALMRMLDNAGFRTGYIYRQPLVKGDPPRPRNDVEVPPAVSSLGYLLEEEEMYKHGNWKKYVDGRKSNDRTRWLNSPNVYQKVEILETGTPDPKKITKWVDSNADEWVTDGSPQHSSTPVKIEHALQFVPKNTNPKEFKKLQQQIKENRRADKITSGPQSHILEGVSWEEAKKLQDANISQTGDQVILVGAASKGIIQRGFQHNATVYKAPYAKNPFDAVSDQEIEDYKKVVNRKQRGESSYDEDQSESEALSSSAALPPTGIKSPASETDDSRDGPRVLRIETKQVPRPSQAEVVLSDEAVVSDVDLLPSIMQRSKSSRYPDKEPASLLNRSNSLGRNQRNNKDGCGNGPGTGRGNIHEDSQINPTPCPPLPQVVRVFLNSTEVPSPCEVIKLGTSDIESLYDEETSFNSIKKGVCDFLNSERKNEDSGCYSPLDKMPQTMEKLLEDLKRKLCKMRLARKKFFENRISARLEEITKRKTITDEYNKSHLDTQHYEEIQIKQSVLESAQVSQMVVIEDVGDEKEILLNNNSTSYSNENVLIPSGISDSKQDCEKSLIALEYLKFNSTNDFYDGNHSNFDSDDEIFSNSKVHYLNSQNSNELPYAVVVLNESDGEEENNNGKQSVLTMEECDESKGEEENNNGKQSFLTMEECDESKGEEENNNGKQPFLTMEECDYYKSLNHSSMSSVFFYNEQCINVEKHDTLVEDTKPLQLNINTTGVHQEPPFNKGNDHSNEIDLATFNSQSDNEDLFNSMYEEECCCIERSNDNWKVNEDRCHFVSGSDTCETRSSCKCNSDDESIYSETTKKESDFEYVIKKVRKTWDLRNIYSGFSEEVRNYHHYCLTPEEDDDEEESSIFQDIQNMLLEKETNFSIPDQDVFIRENDVGLQTLFDSNIDQFNKCDEQIRFILSESSTKQDKLNSRSILMTPLDLLEEGQIEKCMTNEIFEEKGSPVELASVHRHIISSSSTICAENQYVIEVNASNLTPKEETLGSINIKVLNGTYNVQKSTSNTNHCENIDSSVKKLIQESFDPTNINNFEETTIVHQGITKATVEIIVPVDAKESINCTNTDEQIVPFTTTGAPVHLGLNNAFLNNNSEKVHTIEPKILSNESVDVGNFILIEILKSAEDFSETGSLIANNSSFCDEKNTPDSKLQTKLCGNVLSDIVALEKFENVNACSLYAQSNNDDICKRSQSTSTDSGCNNEASRGFNEYTSELSISNGNSVADFSEFNETDYSQTELSFHSVFEEPLTTNNIEISSISSSILDSPRSIESQKATEAADSHKTGESFVESEIYTVVEVCYTNESTDVEQGGFDEKVKICVDVSHLYSQNVLKNNECDIKYMTENIDHDLIDNKPSKVTIMDENNSCKNISSSVTAPLSHKSADFCVIDTEANNSSDTEIQNIFAAAEYENNQSCLFKNILLENPYQPTSSNGTTISKDVLTSETSFGHNPKNDSPDSFETVWLKAIPQSKERSTMGSPDFESDESTSGKLSSDFDCVDNVFQPSLTTEENTSFSLPAFNSFLDSEFEGGKHDSAVSVKDTEREPYFKLAESVSTSSSSSSPEPDSLECDNAPVKPSNSFNPHKKNSETNKIPEEYCYQSNYLESNFKNCSTTPERFNIDTKVHSFIVIDKKIPNKSVSVRPARKIKPKAIILDNEPVTSLDCFDYKDCNSLLKCDDLMCESLIDNFSDCNSFAPSLLDLTKSIKTHEIMSPVPLCESPYTSRLANFQNVPQSSPLEDYNHDYEQKKSFLCEEKSFNNHNNSEGIFEESILDNGEFLCVKSNDTDSFYDAGATYSFQSERRNNSESLNSLPKYSKDKTHELDSTNSYIETEMDEISLVDTVIGTWLCSSSLVDHIDFDLSEENVSSVQIYDETKSFCENMENESLQELLSEHLAPSENLDTSESSLDECSYLSATSVDDEIFEMKSSGTNSVLSYTDSLLCGENEESISDENPVLNQTVSKCCKYSPLAYKKPTSLSPIPESDSDSN